MTTRSVCRTPGGNQSEWEKHPMIPGNSPFSGSPCRSNPDTQAPDSRSLSVRKLIHNLKTLHQMTDIPSCPNHHYHHIYVMCSYDLSHGCHIFATHGKRSNNKNFECNGKLLGKYIFSKQGSCFHHDYCLSSLAFCLAIP